MVTQAPAPTPFPPPSPTPTPTPAPAATPTPVPTFNPGRVILPTVAIPTRTPTPAAEDLDTALDRIASQVSVLRQLFVVRELQQQTITREELEGHLREDFEEDRDDISHLQELYVTLGIIQPGTDLFESYINLYNEVVVGFFDTDEEKLYLVQDGAEFRVSDMLTYAHEFVHGLQQQHFDIHATSEALESNSDKLYAFQALVEGDATLSEGLYMLQHLTQAQ